MLEPVIAKYDTARNDDADLYGVPETVIDFREIVALFFRARYWIAGIFVTCIALGLIITLLTTQQYEGRVLIEVKQEAEKVLGTESDRETASTKLDSDRFFDTQVDITSSRSVTIAVAEGLGLFSNDEFLETMNVSPDDADDRILTNQEARRELVIETLKDELSVGYTGDTRILQIVFASPDARLSARIANAYAEAYIRSNLARKSESSAYALDFLRSQLREAQLRLEQSEREALDYARRTRIVDASNAAGSERSSTNQPQSLIIAQLVQLNESYTGAVADRVQAEQLWRRTRENAPLTSAEVLSNQAIQRLLEQRAVAEANYQEELTNRLEDHPAVRQARMRVEELDRQVNSIASDIQRSVHQNFEIARSREQQLKRQIEELKGNTLTEQNQGIQLSILRREADTNRAQYDALLRRYNQLNAESGVQSNNLAIVDRAAVDPEPAWPNIPLNVALSIIAGLVISSLYVLIQTQLFDRVRTGNDVAQRVGIPLLGALPTSADVIEDAEDPKSEISESVNVIRAGFSLATPMGAPRLAMVTSVQAAEGKSSTCLSLAIAFARLNKQVLIIDLDLRRPNLHRLLELSNSIGASSFLTGQNSLEDSIQKTRFGGVDAITSGGTPPNPTELIMGQALDAMLTEASEKYDLVLVDSAPLLSLADAVILSGRVDATLFIIEAGRNNLKAVQGAVKRVRAAGGHIGGAILTKYDPGRMGYGYDADYTYQYAYGGEGQEA